MQTLTHVPAWDVPRFGPMKLAELVNRLGIKKHLAGTANVANKRRFLGLIPSLTDKDENGVLRLKAGRRT